MQGGRRLRCPACTAALAAAIKQPSCSGDADAFDRAFLASGVLPSSPCERSLGCNNSRCSSPAWCAGMLLLTPQLLNIHDKEGAERHASLIATPPPAAPPHVTLSVLPSRCLPAHRQAMAPDGENIRYSALVQQGLRELLEPEGEGGSLQLACAGFQQALAAEAPGGGELKAALAAVADSVPDLAAALAAVQTAGQLERFAPLMELLSAMLALLEVGHGPDVEALAPPLLELGLALAGAPAFSTALAAPEQRDKGVLLLGCGQPPPAAGGGGAGNAPRAQAALCRTGACVHACEGSTWLRTCDAFNHLHSALVLRAPDMHPPRCPPPTPL